MIRALMKWPKIVLLILVVAFVGMQAVRPARTNPPIDEGKVLAAPPQVKAILDRSCADCHSSRTVWPWYSNVAPVSWLLVDHVNEGRHELSFSEFGGYTDRKKSHKLQEICEQVEKGEMPLKQYVVLHPDARLSEADKQTLCSWSEGERRLFSGGAAPRES
jgi:hypothetical protein